jgi:hypothetical protein
MHFFVLVVSRTRCRDFIAAQIVTLLPPFWPERMCAKKLARSVGGSPAQVRLASRLEASVA